MADGHTWLNDYRHHELMNYGDMELAWSDSSGTEHRRRIPFGSVPDFSEEDFSIYIEPDGSTYCSLGVYGTGIGGARIATLSIGLIIYIYVHVSRATKRRSRRRRSEGNGNPEP